MGKLWTYGLVGVLGATLWAGCVHGHRPPPGPPPHAPAHGRRVHAHHWVYYPDAGVYCCTVDGHYWYLGGGDAWVSADEPPGHVTLGAYVALELVDDEPWHHHAAHREHYPPGQLKAKGPKPGRGPPAGKPGKGPKR